MANSGQTTETVAAVLAAADNLFAAYRGRFLTPSGDRIRATAPLRREMGELRMAVNAMARREQGAADGA